MTGITRLPNEICPICGSSNIRVIFSVSQIPVHCNLLWTTQTDAQNAPKGDIRLGFCENCTHIFNLSFTPLQMEYSHQYENTLHFSPRFQSYATSLVKRLTNRYDLDNKKIIEIGCGKGDFLRLVCEAGNNTGIGFDPSYEEDLTENESNQRIKFIQDFYSEKYAHYEADLICCRHTIEHIYKPKEFLNMLNRAISNGSTSPVVFLEVPNAVHILRELAIWDIIYEHYSYFSNLSLAYLFIKAGFNILDLDSAFGGQYLYIEAASHSNRADISHPIEPNGSMEDYYTDVMEFAERYKEKKAIWKNKIEHLSNAGKRVALWGAGSKGVTFLNMLNFNKLIRYVVDINPRKQGMYVGGTGQEIVPPEFLREYQPDVLIIMNVIYDEEIQQQVRAINVDVEFMYP